MTAQLFVEALYKEKQELLKTYFSSNSEAEVSALIQSLKLSDEQMDILKKTFDSAFSDIIYTILLGLEGSASIGGTQETYALFDEKNNRISGDELEAYAWEYFQEK